MLVHKYWDQEYEIGIMEKFIAIDVETAQGKRWSICQIGLAVVEGGIITETISELVQPPNNEYSIYNTRIHGIREVDTFRSPRFPDVWAKIYPLIQGHKLVAHNASFDKSCLNQALAYYNIE
ncbi:MAG: DNA polymerase-3 subunit epsilon, partial [Luteibaculaceae bacterium]